jgi:N-acetylmuramoyl-L-alanine amidase
MGGAVKKGLILLVLLFWTSSIVSAADPFFMQPVGTIFIDAGHGGKDPGAVAEFDVEAETIRLEEKDINLSIAKQAGAMLRELLPEVDIAYTREDDSYISLWNRTHIANSRKTEPGLSKLFVSIHANASQIEGIEGFEIWKLDPRVEKDLVTSFVGERNLLAWTHNLNDELNEELDAATELLAESLRSALGAELGQVTRDRGIKEGYFHVIDQALMPSILIEMGFLSTKSEALRLNSPEGQEALSSAIAAGILAYIEQITE